MFTSLVMQARTVLDFLEAGYKWHKNTLHGKVQNLVWTLKTEKSLLYDQKSENPAGVVRLFVVNSTPIAELKTSGEVNTQFHCFPPYCQQINTRDSEISSQSSSPSPK